MLWPLSLFHKDRITLGKVGLDLAQRNGSLGKMRRIIRPSPKLIMNHVNDSPTTKQGLVISTIQQIIMLPS